MLIILAAVLVVAWLIGFIGFHVASAGIHLLIILAFVFFAMHFVFWDVGNRRHEI